MCYVIAGAIAILIVAPFHYLSASHDWGGFSPDKTRWQRYKTYWRMERD